MDDLPLSPPGGARALFPEDTYSVSQLGEALQGFIREAFWSVWVVGEVQRLRERGGHLYFELVEKGRGDSVVAKIDVALFRSDRTRVERVLRQGGMQLAEGQVLRCRGRVDFYVPFGRLQLVARDVDPVYSLGVLEQRRRETLAWLAEKDLLDRNGALELAELPLRVGLVTAVDSAAFHDFVRTLEESGFAFEVLFAPSPVQGARAATALAGALRALVRHHESVAPLDVVVLARGGGSKTDLAAFDDRRLAEAIATAPFPVVTGIGHEVDESIADRVSHTRVKTPTGAAELLCARVDAAERRWQAMAERVVAAGRERVRREGERLERAGVAARAVALRLTLARRLVTERGAALTTASRVRLGLASRRLAELRSALPRQGGILVTRREKERAAVGERVGRSAARLLAHAAASLDPLSRLVSELSPQRVLERGYSLTFDDRGRVLRDPEGLAAADLIETRLARGRVRSRVESTERTP